MMTDRYDDLNAEIMSLRQENEQLRKERDAAKKQLQRWADAHDELTTEVELRGRIAELETFIESRGYEVPE